MRINGDEVGVFHFGYHERAVETLDALYLALPLNA